MQESDDGMRVPCLYTPQHAKSWLPHHYHGAFDESGFECAEDEDADYDGAWCHDAEPHLSTSRKKLSVSAGVFDEDFEDDDDDDDDADEPPSTSSCLIC
jgi:hypothetical protein